MLLPKDLYLDLADLLKEEMLPLQLWIYMGIINQGDKTSIYTYGLKEFGKIDPDFDIKEHFVEEVAIVNLSKFHSYFEEVEDE